MHYCVSYDIRGRSRVPQTIMSGSPLDTLEVLRALYKADREGLRRAFEAHGRMADYLKFACNNHLAGTSFFLLEECDGVDLAPAELVSQLKLFYLEQWGWNQRLL